MKTKLRIVEDKKGIECLSGNPPQFYLRNVTSTMM